MKLHGIQKGFEGVATQLESIIKTPVCVPNCGKCCEINTPQWTALEAMNAVSVLMGNGKLTEALIRAEDWLLDRKLAPSHEGMLAGCFVPPKIKAEHENLIHSICPMMNSEKQCLVHEARPLACRAYGVTVSVTDFCPRPCGSNELNHGHMYMKCPELKADISLLWKQAKEIEPKFVIYGFVPTMLYRAAREARFYELVHDNKIASAKIIGTDLDTTLLWQEQADALKAGVTGDLVAAGIYKSDIESIDYSP